TGWSVAASRSDRQRGFDARISLYLCDSAAEVVSRFGTRPVSQAPRATMDRPKTKCKGASRACPCPVCGGIDGCSVGKGGLIFCRRREGPQPGFIYLGWAKGDPQWSMYRHENDPHVHGNGQPRSGGCGRQSKCADNWRAMAEKFAGDFTPVRAKELADVLG